MNHDQINYFQSIKADKRVHTNDYITYVSYDSYDMNKYCIQMKILCFTLPRPTRGLMTNVS